MRGACALLLAVLAVVLPDPFFLQAILGVASLLIVFGVYEIVNAARMRGISYHQWWFPLLDGSAAVCFGLMSVGLTMVPLNVATWLIGGWFVYYALCLLIAAALSDHQDSVRHTLFLAGLFHTLAACVVFLMPMQPRVSILALPSLGAAYVVLFASWQMLAGWWLMHNARNATEHEVFLAPHLV